MGLHKINDGKYERLPVRLDREELELVSKDLARQVHEYDSVEAEKKAVTKELGSKLETLRSRITSLSTVVDTGVRYEDVEVSEFYNDDTGLVERRRVDTYELLGTRASTKTDRQVKLFGGEVEFEPAEEPEVQPA
jgi:hypothetical protein